MLLDICITDADLTWVVNTFNMWGRMKWDYLMEGITKILVIGARALFLTIHGKEIQKNVDVFTLA